jgi:hypothetical protein
MMTESVPDRLAAGDVPKPKVTVTTAGDTDEPPIHQSGGEAERAADRIAQRLPYQLPVHAPGPDGAGLIGGDDDCATVRQPGAGNGYHATGVSGQPAEILLVGDKPPDSGIGLGRAGNGHQRAVVQAQQG